MDSRSLNVWCWGKMVRQGQTPPPTQRDRACVLTGEPRRAQSILNQGASWEHTPDLPYLLKRVRLLFHPVARFRLHPRQCCLCLPSPQYDGTLSVRSSVCPARSMTMPQRKEGSCSRSARQSHTKKGCNACSKTKQSVVV